MTEISDTCPKKTKNKGAMIGEIRAKLKTAKKEDSLVRRWQGFWRASTKKGSTATTPSFMVGGAESMVLGLCLYIHVYMYISLRRLLLLGGRGLRRRRRNFPLLLHSDGEFPHCLHLLSQLPGKSPQRTQPKGRMMHRECLLEIKKNKC